MLLSLFLLAMITPDGQPTPLPEHQTTTKTGFTAAYTYVHETVILHLPSHLLSYRGKWYWMAKSPGTAKSIQPLTAIKLEAKISVYHANSLWNDRREGGPSSGVENKPNMRFQQDLLKVSN